MKNKRYRFYAWLDRKTGYVLGALFQGRTQEPKDEYSLSEQWTLIGWGTLYCFAIPIVYIIKLCVKIGKKFTVKKDFSVEGK